MSMMNNARLYACVIGAAMLLSVSGCAPKQMESGTLADAVDSRTTDTLAQQFCEGYLQGLELIAAIDSTAGEVREIAHQVEVRGPWQDGLPSEDGGAVSICIFDVHGIPGLEAGLTYMAYWGVTSQSQALTAW